MTKANSGQFRPGEHTSPSTEFKKGQAPWNKGRAYVQILGEKHPQWKGGKPKCLDCDTILGTYKTKRCQPCHLSSPVVKEKMAKVREARKLPADDKHHAWKGEAVGYYALHCWIRRKLGASKICWDCGFTSDNSRQFHWANISGEYRRDFEDWARLCVRCHKAYDSGKITLTLIGG